jgi:hypothetical protein
MQQANRLEERVSTALPVTLRSGECGITRNISASGIYFETGTAPVGKGPLSLSIEFPSGAGGLTLQCIGQVVRMEDLGNRVGVAARILELKLAPGRIRPQLERLEVSDVFADSF